VGDIDSDAPRLGIGSGWFPMRADPSLGTAATGGGAGCNAVAVGRQSIWQRFEHGGSWWRRANLFAATVTTDHEGEARTGWGEKGGKRGAPEAAVTTGRFSFGWATPPLPPPHPPPHPGTARASGGAPGLSRECAPARAAEGPAWRWFRRGTTPVVRPVDAALARRDQPRWPAECSRDEV